MIMNSYNHTPTTYHAFYLIPTPIPHPHSTSIHSSIHQVLVTHTSYPTPTVRRLYDYDCRRWWLGRFHRHHPVHQVPYRSRQELSCPSTSTQYPPPSTPQHTTPTPHPNTPPQHTTAIHVTTPSSTPPAYSSTGATSAAASSIAGSASPASPPNRFARLAIFSAISGSTGA
jgi:hypothetical protein